MISGGAGHIDEPDDNGAKIVDKTWGPVITDSNARGFLGATHGTNNTGELQAIGEVLMWANEHMDSNQSLLIRYDSTYAAMITQPVYTASSNRQLALRVQTLYRHRRAIAPVFFSHVDAHTGHKWNECADTLANRGRASSSYDIEQKRLRAEQRKRDRAAGIVRDADGAGAGAGDGEGGVGGAAYSEYNNFSRDSRDRLEQSIVRIALAIVRETEIDTRSRVADTEVKVSTWKSNHSAGWTNLELRIKAIEAQLGKQFLNFSSSIKIDKTDRRLVVKALYIISKIVNNS